MKKMLQVFTGFGRKSEDSPEDIIRRIAECSSRMEVDKIIIGWSTEPSVYRKVGDDLHRHGIKMLLWLPVFSGIPDIFLPDPAIDIFGNPLPVPEVDDSETFHFVCPSSPRNIQIVRERYEKFFSSCGFDGVFLDRIRTQSFVSGVSGVLSCACAHCRSLFLRKGVNPDEVRKLYESRKDHFFDIASWPMNGALVLKDPLAQRFIEVKEQIIADSVCEIAEYFRCRGLIVGLDLFAPVVSRLVGQNYALITRNADFIKPMLYRRTEAPAGVGYELSLFEKAVPDAVGKIRLDTDAAFLHTQLDVIENLPCEKYPGIEINYDKEIVKTDAGYISESLNAVKAHDFEGAALCWNIMRAPREHINAAALS